MKTKQILWGAILVLMAGTWAPARAGDAAPAASSEPAALPAAPAAQPAAAEPSRGGVFGVFEHYTVQVYAGYSFFQFHELSTLTQDSNGFNFGMVYYPAAGRFGGDGEMMVEWGTQGGRNTHFVAGMGGLRCRFGVTRGAEWWIHGLAGHSNFLPQTIYGPQGAFAYEAGGGLDISPRRGHLAYRIQADAVGTNFFGTYQYSPKVSAGIVLKF